MMKSNVVYQFICANCNICYVGCTTCHLATRIKQHIHTDKNSVVYKHLQLNPNCKIKCSDENFEIIDMANTEFDLQIKEAIHIRRIDPALNKQIKSYKMTLAL